MASPPPPKPKRPVTLKLRTPSASAAAAAAAAAAANIPSNTITSAPLVATPSAMSPPPATPGGGMKIILKRTQLPSGAPTASPSVAAAAAEAHSSKTHANGTKAGASANAGSITVSAPPRVALPTSAPSSLLSSAPVTTQKGRVSKPTAKKRARDLDDSDDDELMMTTTSGRRGGGGGHDSMPKRPKLIVKKTTALKNRTASIVLKQVAKEAPPRSKGEGYDSEDDDREPDPLIEEEIVLRMLPGEHCEYLRRMIEERKIGVPVKDGGADVQLRWLSPGGAAAANMPHTASGPGSGPSAGDRRALVTIKGQPFVGVLVDLPTITEGMKSWDKRNFMKAADICQMLLVFARVADEAEARAVPLPSMVTKDFRWPHGLTPPMHDCVHRRFRKRLSKKEIKDKEAELQRLLNEDKMAVESKWELFDDGRMDSDDEEEDDIIEEEEEDADMFGDEDAEGDVDIEYAAAAGAGAAGDAPDIDEAELMAEFLEDDDDDDAGTAAGGGGGGGGGTAGGGSGAGGGSAAAGAGTAADAATPAGQDDDDDDDEDDDDDDDLDEDEQARAEQAKGVREDINDLKKNLENLDAQLAGTTNALLRKRIEATKKKVLSELRLKQASIGEIDEE